MEFAFAFLALFIKAIVLVAPFLAGFLLVIVGLGQWVGRREGWSRFDAFYWSMITALTVGYGDLRPSHKSTKFMAILVAIVGIMFSGVFVAVTVAAATEAFRTYKVDA